MSYLHCFSVIYRERKGCLFVKGSSIIKSTLARTIMLLAFFALPLFNLFRIDLLNFHFYVLGHKFNFSKGYILLVAVLLLVFTFVTIAKWFGRQFCGWVCPHHKFVMFLNSIQNTKLLKGNRALKFIVEYGVILLASPIISYGFIAYFYDPIKLFNEIITFDYKNYSMLAMAIYTVFFFVMLHRKIRYNYCRNNCPYGILQMAIRDKDSVGNVSGFKNALRGTGTILTFILLLLVSILAYGLITNKGYTPSILKMEQGRVVGDYVSYSYELSIENLESKPVTYKINFKDVPSTWITDLPTELTVNNNETVSRDIFFKVDESTLNTNHIIVVEFINERGKVVERTIPLYPFKRI